MSGLEAPSASLHTTCASVTGPYEEMMQTVKCPEGLKKKLRGVWMKRKKGVHRQHNHSFDVLKDVLSSLEGVEGETIFCDTLYRYLVLLSSSSTGECHHQGTFKATPLCSSAAPPSQSKGGQHVFNRQGEQLKNSEIWKVVKEICWEEARGREAECSRQQFHQDTNLWSLSSGTHPTIERFGQQTLLFSLSFSHPFSSVEFVLVFHNFHQWQQIFSFLF
jgi:hypothetical protein